MAWTKAQQKVIDTRNRNVLVSAAAGSGKTAVLVERIISMISEGENPIDIDRLLVVTFTNAAAAEMRSRIGKAIEEKLLKQPDNQHLQKQISLLQSAQITTIHSFCLNVIRNYFHRIDLDPSFKIAEESEITLMKSDVISDLLERWYEVGTDDFHTFVESYSYSKSDAPIEDLILQLYNFSMSDPWPKEWIAQKRRMFDLHSPQELAQASWMKEIFNYIEAVLCDLIVKNQKALDICNEIGGPAAYIPALLSDRSLLVNLKDAASYEESRERFAEINFARLSGKKEEGVEPWKKDHVKALREDVKKGIKDITAQFFFQTPEEMLKDIQEVGKVMQVLFDLTLEFMEEFAKKKEEKNLIDFNDLEHFALKILVNEEPTQAALELSEQFEEILIDEYQDSNMVQETILKSISREAFGKPNRFMVGDVKQSIYKFRLAMPEIFMEKYETYSSEDETVENQINLYQRIDLDKNFRSRKIVLDYVNKIFEQIMQKPVGGIIYDDAASLKYGELFEETLDHTISSDVLSRTPSQVDLLLLTEEEFSNNDTDSDSIMENGQESSENRNTSQETQEDVEEAIYTKRELEARMIARKIKELTDPVNGMLVFDKKNNGHRPATYKDIVVLTRTMTGWSEVFVNTLMNEGISAYAETGTGYFQTLEIMTVLNLLRIIDNPRQDIPLTGVLYSPIVGFTTTELATIRASARNVSMYNALLTYAEEGTREELKGKVSEFLELLRTFRSMVNYKPIHEMIQTVLDQTGYYYYVSAMPGGDRRKANIDMLISQAVRFEKGSYTGLFHFIRYIEKLHKYEVDFGEATTSGEQDDTVRIMSIHKSKGLEFPIVFVAGMSKQFNTQDLRSSIVLHSEMGVGPEYIDCKLRTKVPTLIKKAIQKKVQIENLGEELRVLYVALTRPKEKLILTGYLDSMDEIQEKDFSFFELLSAKSYLDWVLPATVNQVGWNPQIINHDLVCSKDTMSITIVHKNTLLKEELKKQIFLQKDEEDLRKIDPDTIYSQPLKDELKTRFDYVYPYLKEKNLKVKMTVSELKKLGQYQDEEQSVNLYQKPEAEVLNNNFAKSVTEIGSKKLGTVDETIKNNKDINLTPATVPNFISQQEVAVTGTDRGTLYHKVLELLDLTNVSTKDEVSTELQRMVADNRIKEEDVKKLKAEYIKNFVTSEVAGRMRQAALAGKLYKEQQFVIGIKASEVMKDVDSEELILIQGIIDVYFEEDGELVLLDYKSDLVQSEEQLIKRYKVQLEYYRRALEQMFHKKVKEMIIYSLPFGKEIRIEE
jgi:ATP-dependent exoDNAse (exonuclease V) beta subunit (contains helicase and exonuclease domains)